MKLLHLDLNINFQDNFVTPPAHHLCINNSTRNRKDRNKLSWGQATGLVVSGFLSLGLNSKHATIWWCDKIPNEGFYYVQETLLPHKQLARWDLPYWQIKKNPIYGLFVMLLIHESTK